MDKVFHDNGDGTFNVSCTYKQDEYAPIIAKVADNLISKVTVKGFRTGKAPKEMAIRLVKDQDIYNGMIDKLIDKDFSKLLDGFGSLEQVANIRPSLSIDFDKKNKVYNLLYTYVFLPKCEVKKTSGYGVKYEENKIGDKEIEDEIGRLLKDNSELVPSQEAAVIGDHTTLDFIGYIDGKEFEGGSANAYELVLGSKSFVPGFEEEIVGMKEGDRKTIEVTFPANYLASLANKKAKFAVTCKGVKKVVLPKADDEFASSLQDYKVKTLEELKKVVADRLLVNEKARAKTAKVNAVLDLISKDAKPVIAARYIELAANAVQEDQLKQFKQYGLDLEGYLKIAGLTPEQFKDNCKKTASEQAVKFAVIKGIAAAANISATQEDIESRFGGKEKYESLMESAKKQQLTNPDFSVESYLNSIKDSIVGDKVNDYLFANN